MPRVTRRAKQDVIHRLVKGMGPMVAALGIVGVLLLRQPDLGALVVIVSIAMGILFLGGIGMVWFGGICISPDGHFWRGNRFISLALAAPDGLFSIRGIRQMRWARPIS